MLHVVRMLIPSELSKASLLEALSQIELYFKESSLPALLELRVPTRELFAAYRLVRELQASKDSKIRILGMTITVISPDLWSTRDFHWELRCDDLIITSGI